MDTDRFDQFTRLLGTPGSRRTAVRGLFTFAGGTSILALLGDDAGAKKGKKTGKGKDKKKDKKKCDRDEKDCGKKCVNLQRDKANCGSCGNACGESGDIECCQGACTNLGSDRFNCGDCGNACNQDEDCIQRSCQPRCVEPEIRCFLSCVNVQTDIDNCGSCGNRCQPNEICSNGKCLCQGPKCNGTRCCPYEDGVCCPNGKCCAAGLVCDPDGVSCCLPGEFPCGDGFCCPNGKVCGGGVCLDP